MYKRDLINDSLYTANEKFIVVLDSRNATTKLNGTMNSYVSFNFGEPIYVAKDALQFSCSVLSFNAPNSIYNVNATNNFLSISYFNGTSSIPLKVTIPPGNYNANTFSAKLVSLCNTIDATFGAGFSITLNPITNKYTFNSTYPFNILLESTCSQVVGFDANSEVFYGQGITTSYAIFMPYTCNFNGVQSINIHFDSIVCANLDSYHKTCSTVIQSISVDPNLAQISYAKSTDYSFTIKQEIIDEITISIRDDLQQFIDFNNQHWNLTLYFSVIKDVDRFSHEQDFRRILQFGYHN